MLSKPSPPSLLTGRRFGLTMMSDSLVFSKAKPHHRQKAFCAGDTAVSWETGRADCLASSDDLKARTGTGANSEERLLPAKPQTPFSVPFFLLLLILLPFASFVKASKGLAQDYSLEI